MASRPEVARKLLLFWMDAMMVLIGVLTLSSMVALAVTKVLSPQQAIFGTLCVWGVVAFIPPILRAAYDDRPRPTLLLILSGLLALGTLVMIPRGLATPTWEVVGAVWLSGLAIYVRWRVSVAFGVLVFALTVAASVLISGQSLISAALTEAVNVVVVPLAMWLWLWLWRVIREAHESKEAKARLAVAEERLRFARDLHDLLGHSLSVIALKSELSAKLATKDRERAAGEMGQVRELAEAALTEVEAAVEGYRALDLQLELDRVRAVLEAAGTRCTFQVSADDLPEATRTLLAWVVREGATNVLKHSTAGRCDITVGGGVLEMRNNGVRTPRRSQGDGSGLRGLAERLTSAGGSFSATFVGSDEFLLRAEVPV
ncbi:sensor histidine kinase [Nonomuraea longicatena]|uniref:Histidine kinase n=1 Tax=Nonomuraea longicatena TaxID=83682 RepID=A0ABN1NMC0_9ACTN